MTSVGSDTGKIYFVQVSTKSHAVSLRTTLEVAFPGCRRVLIDSENKSFYVLDAGETEDVGRIVTLAPTELGNIEEKSVCPTDLIAPCFFTMIGHFIYVLSETGYAVLRGPKAPKTVRQRRTSKLEPVHEDLVAESLIELFAISHRMDTDNAIHDDPAPALNVIRENIQGETAADVLSMGMVIPCDDKDPLRKLVPDGKDDFIFGLTASSLRTYRAQERDGALMPRSKHAIEGAIDMATDDASCFVLTLDRIVQMAVVGDGILDEVQVFPLPLQPNETALSIHVTAYALWVQCPGRILQINILSQETTSLPVACRRCYISPDGQILITTTEDAIQLRDGDGKLLNETKLAGLAEMTRMS